MLLARSCLEEGGDVIHVAPKGWEALAWLGSDTTDNLFSNSQDDLLGCVAIVEVPCYQALNVWWYVEEMESNVNELVGNRPIGISKV